MKTLTIEQALNETEAPLEEYLQGFSPLDVAACLEWDYSSGLCSKGRVSSYSTCAMKLVAKDPDLLSVIGDGKVIFSVGQSLDPFQRLDEHLGKSVRMFASPVGKLAQDYFPASLAWIVQFFTLEDCVPAVQHYCTEYYPSYRELKQEKLRIWKK